MIKPSVSRAICSNSLRAAASQHSSANPSSAQASPARNVSSKNSRARFSRTITPAHRSTAGGHSDLLAVARRLAPGGAVVIGGEIDSMPLLAGRGRINGADAAYICRGQVCDLPVIGPEELAAALGVRV